MWGSLANKTWASTSQSTGGSCMRPSDSRSGTRRTYPVLADPDARASRVVTSPSEAAEVASACNREISGILRRLTSELPVSGYSEAAGGLEPTSPPRRHVHPPSALLPPVVLGSHRDCTSGALPSSSSEHCAGEVCQCRNTIRCQYALAARLQDSQQTPRPCNTNGPVEPASLILPSCGGLGGGG